MSDNHSDKDTNKEGDENDNRNLNSLVGDGLRARLARNGIEFVSGIGFYAFGDDCTNWGFIYWGFFFHYLCIVFGALIVAEHALSLWPSNRNRVWVVYIGMCILLAVFYIKSSWPSPPSPSFSIVHLNEIHGPTNGGLVLALYQIPGPGKPTLPVTVLSPIPDLMYVQLTNLKERSVRIDSYSLEAEIMPRRWISVSVIGPMDARFFYSIATNWKEATELDFSDSGFDGKINHNSIGPHESVDGWIFANLPTNKFSGRWRMRITDSIGQEYVQIINNLTNSSQNEIVRALIKSKEIPVDLTGHPLIPLK